MKTSRSQHLGGLLLVLLSLIAPGRAVGAAFQVSLPFVGINLPIFDSSGQMIRRLSARSGHLAQNSLQLETGKVEFFSAGAAGKTTTTVDFDQARYTEASERIEGEGALTITAKDGVVRGRGFEGGLETGLFVLKSAVEFTSEEFQLTGDRSEVRFDAHTSKDLDAIRSVELTEHVTFMGEAAKKRGWERAETTLARYDADQSKILLKTPITVWKKNDKGQLLRGELESTDLFFSIDLVKKPVAPKL